MTQISTLNKLAIGRLGVVASIREDEPVIFQRMMEMGIVEGVSIEVLGFAPLGDPMRVKVNGSVLAIRKAEAGLIEVALAQSTPRKGR